jgi:GTP-binding protein
MPAEFLTSLTDIQKLPHDGKPQIAIVGRSNVGKSSLINHLTARKNLARVSSKPGRTQTMNLFIVDNEYYLVDLPGYGYAKISKEKREGFLDMMSDYLSQTPQIKMVFMIIDASIPSTELDQNMFTFLKSVPLPTTIILNKIDKLTKFEMEQVMESVAGRYPGIPTIAHSALAGKGRDEIWKAIEAAI